MGEFIRLPNSHARVLRAEGEHIHARDLFRTDMASCQRLKDLEARAWGLRAFARLSAALIVPGGTRVSTAVVGPFNIFKCRIQGRVQTRLKPRLGFHSGPRTSNRLDITEPNSRHKAHG